jgi:hypothetical protein
MTLIFKARLVAKGFSQVKGIHFLDTYAPTLNHVCLKIVLALSITQNYSMHSMDVNTAFLIPILPEKEVVYLRPPKKFSEIMKTAKLPFSKNSYLKLNKTIYGLKQAACYFYNDLSTALVSIKFIRTKADPCLFYNSSWFSFIAIWVDDILIICPSKHIFNIKKILSSKFPLKDLVPTSLYVGIEI